MAKANRGVHGRRGPLGGRWLAGAAIIVLACWLALGALAAPRAAWADEAPPDVPRNAVGTCHIGETWMVGRRSFFTVPRFSGLLAGAVPSSVFECQNPTAKAAEDVDATYEAQLVGFDVEDGWVEYYVFITPPNATDGVTLDENGWLDGYQRVAGNVRLAWDFKGGIELAKRSASPELTQGNPLYRLDGALFGVFEDEQAARVRDAGAALATYETGADGTWASGNAFSARTYYVAELEAPAGFALCDEVQAVEVRPNETSSLEFADAPVASARVEARKVDAETGRALAQGDATLAGTEIRFSYYAGRYDAGSLPASATRTWVMRADGQGVASLSDGEAARVSGDAFYRDAEGNVVVPLGTLVATEAAAPAGYLGNAAWVAIVEADGQDVSVQVADQAKRGNLEVLKADADTGGRRAQGDATLAGAAFEVVNRSARAVTSPETGIAVEPGGIVCTILTDEAGRASTASAAANGWEMPEAMDGKALAFGTYEVREARAPQGYRIDGAWSETFEVRSDGQLVTFSLDDPVMRGGLTVEKVERESGQGLEQGASSLAGWSFEVVNASANPVVVDGALFGAGEVVCTITAEDVGGSFIASTGANRLPYGTYEVHEAATMRPRDNGHLFDAQSQAWSRTFTIREDGQAVAFTGADACSNQVVRGDLALVKVESPDMGRLAGVPFLITSKTTGERHLAVTDRNGQLSTASSMNPHSANANANDQALGDDGAVDESLLDDEAGVWFSGRADLPTDPDDDLGALPFDTYTVEELPVSANAGMELVGFEIGVYRDGAVVDVGTVDDAAVAAPAIATSLSDAEGRKAAACAPGTGLVDTVDYENLRPGRAYTLVGEIHRVEDGQPVELLATSQMEFAPRLSHGSVELPFEVDTADAAGSALVCFERLLDADGDVVASHEDASDEGQTVHVPAIRTELVDEAAGGHVAAFEDTGSYCLVDTVSYQGLSPDTSYTLTGTLHDKASGEPLLDAHGSPVTATRSFTPEEPEGTVEVVFAFRLAQPASEVVAFETLRHQGVEYAVHADLSDEAQTVRMEGPAAPPEEEPEAPAPAEEPQPSAETPEQPEEPVEEPNAEEARPALLAKTGDALFNVALVLVPAGALGLALAALSVRKMQREHEIVIERGRPVGSHARKR